MYKARFSATNQQAKASHLELTLDDEAVLAMLRELQTRDTEARLGGDRVVCQLCWSSQAQGYVVGFAGEQVGLILKDELKRSLTVPAAFAEKAVGCRFSIEFAGALVWRAGLYDEATGKAVVLTTDKSLSYLPASLWLAVEGTANSAVLGLAVGDVMDAFSLTSQQLQWLGKQQPGSGRHCSVTGDVFLNVDADDLVALTEAGMEFAASCSGRQDTL